jgi:opacity protein-like surface antigen
VNGFYRVVDGDKWDLDLTAGVRGYWLETDFTLSAPNTDADRRRRLRPTGSTGSSAPGPGPVRPWGLTGQIDSGWGSDTSSWQGQALAEYDLSSRWRLMGGYRYLHFENDKGRVDVDLDLKGSAP